MKLILACDTNGGIGYKNKLPWKSIEHDLPRFKQLTENKVVVMGRNTWESLPIKPLPRRTNIVVSTTLKNLDNALVLPNLGKLKFADDTYLIGGAKLVESVWGYISTIYLTKTFSQYTCDTYIDLLKLQKEFVELKSDTFNDHTFTIYKRKWNNITIY